VRPNKKTNREGRKEEFFIAKTFSIGLFWSGKEQLAKNRTVDKGD